MARNCLAKFNIAVLFNSYNWPRTYLGVEFGVSGRGVGVLQPLEKCSMQGKQNFGTQFLILLAKQK
jgi:hypothetical protein